MKMGKDMDELEVEEAAKVGGAVIILLTKLIFGLLCLPLGKRGVRILLGRFQKVGGPMVQLPESV